VTRRHHTTALILLALLNAVGFMDRVVVAVVAQPVKAEFALSDMSVGLLGGTAFALMNTLISLPVARAAEKWSRARLTSVFALLGSLFTLLAGFSTGFGQLLVCRLGMATGSAATEAPPHSMISDMFPPDRRASALSLFMLGVPVAALLGSFGGGAIAQAFGWRGTFQAFGALGVIIALACLFWLKEPARGQSSAPAGPGIVAVLAQLAGLAEMRWLLLATSLVGLGSYGINTFLPAFFARDYGLGPAQAGLAFGLLSGVASLIGTIVGGYGAEWAARHDRRWLLGFPALGLALGVPLFLTGMFCRTLPLSLSLMLLGACSFYTMMGPAIATLHAGLDSRSRATGSALFLLAAHLIGQGLGPPLIGMLSDGLSASLYAPGHYAAACAGLAAQIPSSPCAAASAKGLRIAIAAWTACYAAGGLALLLSARAGANHETR